MSDGFWAVLKELFDSVCVRSVEKVAIEDWKVELQKDCRIYRGCFVTCDTDGDVLQYVQGRVVEWPGLPPDVYLRNPPLELRQHDKGPCLQLVNSKGPWFKLHWQKPARDFDESRAYVEHLLAEAFQTMRRKRVLRC